MKRTGIRVVLAVVLSLVLLIGTLSYASAAKPSFTFDGPSMILHDYEPDGDWRLYGTATLNNYGVKYYVVEWLWNNSGTWERVGSMSTYTLSTRTKSGTLALWGPDNLDASYCGDQFSVRVYVTNKNFRLNSNKMFQSPAKFISCTSE